MTPNIPSSALLGCLPKRCTISAYSSGLEILADELDFLGISIEQLAKYIKVSENNIEQVLRGQVNLTADIALRLGYFFNTGAEMWMNLQKAYELDVARQQLGDKLELIVPWRSLSSTSEDLSISSSSNLG